MLCFISTRLNEPTSAQQIDNCVAVEWEVRIDKKVAEQAAEIERLKAALKEMQEVGCVTARPGEDSMCSVVEDRAAMAKEIERLKGVLRLIGNDQCMLALPGKKCDHDCLSCVKRYALNAIKET